MTSRRIDQIPASKPVETDDQIAIWQDGRTRVATIRDLITGPIYDVVEGVTGVNPGDPLANLSLKKAANLSDLLSSSTARNNLGLGSSATRDVGVPGGVASYDDVRFSQGGEYSGPVTVAQISDATQTGKQVLTGTPSSARSALGLGSAATLNASNSGAAVVTGSDADARVALGLGAAATKSIGVSGGVAAYDDPRFSNSGSGGGAPSTVTASQISDASTSGRSVLTGTPSQGRVALGVDNKLEKTGDRTAFPSLGGITAPAFGGFTPRIVFGHNPSNQQGFSDATDKNPITLLVDLGYGDPSFSGLATPEALTGAISMPSNGVMYNHCAGVAGYAKNYSLDQTRRPGAVGVYGEGNAMVPDVNVWGFNSRTNDNGNSTYAIWGYECDINVHNAKTFARGIDIVGGSSVQFDQASPAIIIQSPGVGYSGTPNPIRWGKGVYLADESCYSGIEVGTAFIQPNVGSMPITFHCRNGSSREEAFRIYAAGNNGTIEATSNNSLLRLRGKSGGNLINTLTVNGNNVGIGSLSDIPQYTADVGGSFRVKGEARFEGAVGFFGAAPVQKPVISGQLTNNEDMLARIINALVTLGLVTNNTTY